MNKLVRYGRLWKVCTAKSIKSMLTYKWSFVINCISQALDYGVSFLLMWVMISSFGTIGGWSAHEVMLLYAISLLCYGIAGTFFFVIMISVTRSVHDGSFDDVLVKPVKVLPYLMCSNFMCNSIAHIILLGNGEALAGSFWLYPVCALLYFALVCCFFNWSIGKYKSTGS